MLSYIWFDSRYVDFQAFVSLLLQPRYGVKLVFEALGIVLAVSHWLHFSITLLHGNFKFF